MLLLDNSCVPDCFYTFLLKVQYDKDIVYFTDCCACSFQTQQLVNSRYSVDNDKCDNVIMLMERWTLTLKVGFYLTNQILSCRYVSQKRST